MEAIEKQNPGAAATATRVKKRHTAKSAKATVSTRRGRRQDVARARYTATSGQETIGYVKEVGDLFMAITEPHRRSVGKFRSVREAFRAVSDAWRCAHA